MLVQPRKIRLIARQAETTERELLAPRLQACDRPVRHWETHQNRLRDRRSRGEAAGRGFGLGFVGSPVSHTTGDFVLALGLRCARRLERRFKLQPQLPAQSVRTAVRYSGTIADVLVLAAAGQDFPLAL